MRIPQEECSCTVCGGVGVGNMGVVWMSPVHKDPSVCRYYLDQRQKKIEEQENNAVKG